MLAAVAAGCGTTSQRPAPRLLGVELRVLGPISVGHPTRVDVVVHNGGATTRSAAVVVTADTEGDRGGLGLHSVASRQGVVQPVGNPVRSSPLGPYRSIVSGLKPGEARTIPLVVMPSDVFPGLRGGKVLVISADVSADASRRFSPGSSRSTAFVSASATRRVAPPQLSLQVRGPAAVRVGSYSRFSVIVRNVGATAVVAADVLIDAVDPGLPRRVPVKTDWPAVSTVSGETVAHVRNLRPGAEVYFHATAKFPAAPRRFGSDLVGLDVGTGGGNGAYNAAVAQARRVR